MSRISEYEVENLFIDKLESIGYTYIELSNYDDVVANFRKQLETFNKDKLIDKKGNNHLSDTEFNRVMLHMENNTVYDSAKKLRDKYILSLDNGETVYLEFFSSNTNRNIFQVTHQVTMDAAHKNDVVYKNRYDVTVLINGLPLVQIELKRPGVEINEAINQINRYRKFSFKGLFRFLQLFVVSNSVQTKYFCNENEMMDGKYNPIIKSLVFFWTDDKNMRINDLNSFTAEFFRKTSLIEMIDKYMVIKATEPVLMVMRPYQIYAVKAAKKRVLDVNQNGYVFACTGSGKTLTSFKLAQILRDEPLIDKVIFLIDRKDLDDQTVDEYNSFEVDCVDNTDKTYVLINQLKDITKKMIVTTIQKMANAIKTPRYEPVMDGYKKKKVVFIIDECHRSQFGKMHGQIKKHFEKATYVGFTGTPIFAKNKGASGRTTADVFYAGDKLESCLHKYMIKDAIADGNVLKFSVEYQRTIFAHHLAIKGIDPEYIDDPEYCKRHGIDITNLYHDDERIANISQHILDHYESHVHIGKDIYTALFAVDCIPVLGKYYKKLKELNEKRPFDKQLRIAAIFTYQANEDMDEGADEHSQELLDSCIQDYNQMFGTHYGIDTFDAYRKDIAKRMKQKEEPQVDILLVVNMFLTGFDAKPLNTLYLDKNLIWHTLVQAYSRTNRVDKTTKQYGQIVSYRNIKQWQDDALTLFSGDGDPNGYLLENYDYYVNRWVNQVPILRRVAPTVWDAGQLQSEDHIKQFILAFRALAQTLATLKTFSKFDWADLQIVMDENEYEGYKSWYLYFYDLTKKDGPNRVPVPVDVDFDIELVRTDRINVVYILNLLKKAQSASLTEEERRKDIDLIIREVERSDNESLRLKKDIMIEFINKRFFDLPNDVDVIAAFDQFEKESLEAEIEEFAYDKQIDKAIIKDLYSEYVFNNNLGDESVRKQLEPYKLGLLKITSLTKSIKTFVENTFKKYSAEGD